MNKIILSLGLISCLSFPAAFAGTKEDLKAELQALRAETLSRGNKIVAIIEGASDEDVDGFVGNPTPIGQSVGLVLLDLIQAMNQTMQDLDVLEQSL